MPEAVVATEAVESKKKPESVVASPEVSQELANSLTAEGETVVAEQKKNQKKVDKKKSDSENLSNEKKEVKSTQAAELEQTKEMLNTPEVKPVEKILAPANAPGEIKIVSQNSVSEEAIASTPETAKTQNPSQKISENDVKEKKEKKPTNISKSPLQWTAGTVTGVAGAGATLLAKIPAKAMDIVASPGQLFKKEFWKDVWFNAKKSPKNLGRTLTSGFRKEDKIESVNMQKDYVNS